jgi:hypothetical protein
LINKSDKRGAFAMLPVIAAALSVSPAFYLYTE